MKSAMGMAAALLVSGCATADGRTQLVKTETLCQDQTVPIYFASGSAEVPREGKLVLGQAASRQAGCKVTAVDVVGLSEAAGAPRANLELSQRRADAVAAVLAQDGLPAARFKVGVEGGTGAPPPDGKTAPLQRRVEVTLHLTRS